MEQTKNKKLIDISTKTFISVAILLFLCMVAAIVMTYVLPKGEFIYDAEGKITAFNDLGKGGGINIAKGIFSPFLLLGADGGIAIIMLCIFLLVIAGAFQAMNDNNGIKVIVNRIINRFTSICSNIFTFNI